MRFLALCLIALSFASSTTGKIIIGSTPPVWPLSFSSDYSSIYSAVPESSIQGSITISNNEKIRVESTGPHHSFQSIIIKEQGEGDKKNDADIYCTRKFGDFPSRCHHSKHPFNPFLLNENNQCLEFQYKGEGLINGIIANGWSTICSISKNDLFHHPPMMRGNEEERGGEMIQFAMTYYYQDSIPYAIVSSPLSGPGVNTNATIIYSNFQSINPDASLFTPPTNCEEKGEERKHWGHKSFGGGNDGGLYRDESHPRYRDHHSRSTPDNFIELPKKGGEGIHRSLKDRRIRFTDQHEEINGKKDDEMMHDQPDRHMIRRHDMEEMPPKRGEMRGHMGEIGGPIIGGDGMDGHHGLIGGGDHDNHGESHKDFRGKRLAVHVTKMALKLIHFVNTKYLQKQG